MSKYGYPPSHRRTRDPQPEVCDLCGSMHSGARMRRSETKGLRGHLIGLEHPIAFAVSGPDIKQRLPGLPGEKYVGQSRVYEPGAATWHTVSPLVAIRDDLLSDNDILLVADDLSLGVATTWTDRKSAIVFTATGSPTVAVDSVLGSPDARYPVDRHSIALDGSSYFTSSGYSHDPEDGISVVVVVKITTPSSTSQVVIAQQDGTGTGRSWIRSIPTWESGIGLANTTTSRHTPQGWEIVALRTSDNSTLHLLVNNREVASYAVNAVEAASGELVLGASKGGASIVTGSLAAAVVATSDVGRQNLAQITGYLNAYYGVV